MSDFAAVLADVAARVHRDEAEAPVAFPHRFPTARSTEPSNDSAYGCIPC